MKIERFEDLVCWQKSKRLVLHVYEITNKESFANDHSLKNQIRRAAISAPSNIAEGFERNGAKEFTQFLSIAKGSLGELRTQLLIAFELNYFSKTEYETCNQLALECSKLCHGLISYLKSTEIKGSKYQLKEEDFLYQSQSQKQNLKH